MSQALDFIKKTSYFSGLSDAQLTKIASKSTVQTYTRGSSLLKESDRGDQVFLIMDGRAEISVSLVGNDKIETIAVLSEGEMVGEMILLGKMRRSANVTAKDDLQVIVWHGNELLKLFEEDNHIGYIVMRNIAQHIAERLVGANQVLRNALSVSHGPIF